jgi:hypothetical protein
MPYQQSIGLLAIASACMLSGECMPQVAAQPPESPQSPNPLVSAAITCAEFRLLLHSDPKTAGVAILWLEGYYSGRVGLPALPAGWARTVSQGIGGTCAISLNASRSVVDVIAQVHREHGG